MNANAETPTTESQPNLLAGILKRLGTIAAMFTVIAAILFLAAGRLTWPWAWLYLGISIASVMINGVVMLRTNPGTIAERGEAKLTRKWDQIVSSLYALAMYLLLPLVAGLDLRMGWTADPDLAAHLAGAVTYAAGLGLFAWGMIANAYFSTAVRIQTDRGHTVCDSGPYRFVRHPGYASLILQGIGVPILLGSFWALIPGVAAAVLISIRTSFEDRTLRAELPGYVDYVQRVRWRLIPGIW
jgi:protein-S-isoprenylcysteine O-methyltransferase Ste14